MIKDAHAFAVRNLQEVIKSKWKLYDKKEMIKVKIGYLSQAGVHIEANEKREFEEKEEED